MSKSKVALAKVKQESTASSVIDAISGWEQEQKRKLVDLGQGPKSYKEILSYLKNEIALADTMVDVNYTVKCFRDDGVYQLNRAIEELVGASPAKIEKNPSGGTRNVETLDIELANGVRKKVIYGAINLPDMGEDANINIGYNFRNRELFVTGSCQHKFSPLMDQIINRTKQLLNTESIYKDMAIELDGNFTPKALNLSNIDKELMVISTKVQFNLRPLLGRIRNPEECKAKGIPLKYGVLFSGRYGEPFSA